MRTELDLFAKPLAHFLERLWKRSHFLGLRLAEVSVSSIVGVTR